MLKKCLLSALFVLFAVSSAVAELRVEDAVITTGVENQAAVDEVQVFAADYGKLFCYTRIVGAETDTNVTHVWYYGNDVMAEVELAVGSSDWRTYSSKRFLPQWAGEWTVVVQDDDDVVLATIPFRLE